MSAQDNGGPAFPESYVGMDRPHAGVGDGMTLRDYAAIKFAAAILANPAHHEYLHFHDERSAIALKAADAMLKAMQA